MTAEFEATSTRTLFPSFRRQRDLEPAPCLRAADPFLNILRSCRDFSNDLTRGRRFVMVQV